MPVREQRKQIDLAKVGLRPHVYLWLVCLVSILMAIPSPSAVIAHSVSFG